MSISTIRTVRDMREWQRTIGDRRVGFVATMGALHSGHASLIEHSVSDCDLTVVSIYVNPTQFDQPEDLKSTPGRSKPMYHWPAQWVQTLYSHPRGEKCIRMSFAIR